MPVPYRVAVLTVSDTAARLGPTYDTSGPLLTSLIQSHSSYVSAGYAIVPDDEKAIQRQVASWAGGVDERVDWIITTGGTGFSPTDVTPQSLLPYLLPLTILQHALNDYFLKSTAKSILSRPLVGMMDIPSLDRLRADLGPSGEEGGPAQRAGERSGTVVLCLPGSRGACKDGWAAMTGGPLKNVLEHGLSLLVGGSGCGDGGVSSRGASTGQGVNDTGSDIVHPPRESVRRDNVDGDVLSLSRRDASGHQGGLGAHLVGAEDECGCGRIHEDLTARNTSKEGALSVDPSKSVARRLRKSPFPMIPLSEALDLVKQHSQPLPAPDCAVDHTLRNHVLAEDIFAEADLPPTRTTNVDGYAVMAEDTPPGVYDVIPPQYPMPKVPPGKIQVYRINTGGPLPPGTDAVIMVEDTELVGTNEDGSEAQVRVLKQVKAGDEVRQPGSDAMKGEKVLSAGTIIGSSGGEIGLLGFVGYRGVSAYRKPVVAIMSTGNELVDLQARRPNPAIDSIPTPIPGWTGIVDTNRPSLRAAIEGFGYEVVDLGIAKDNMEEHLKLFRRGLEKADVIITTGGTSMGESDLLKPMIEHELGGTIHFGRVAMKPGKPTTFASIPSNIPGGAAPTLVFALPGNPASALVTFHLFCLPALRGLGGWPETRRQLPRVKVTLENDMPLDPREEFHRVIITPSKSQPGLLLARTTGGQRSSRVASLCGANGFVHLPAKVAGGITKMSKGEMADAMIIGEIHI